MNAAHQPEVAGPEMNPRDASRSVTNLEARARRAAKRVGLIARKSRWRVGSPDNAGGFAVFDPSTNFIVYGWGYDLEPEVVIDYCAPDLEE